MKKKRNDLLRRAFIEADVEYFESITKNTTIEWIPSDEFVQKMEKLINKYSHKPRRSWTDTWKKAVCAALIFAIVIGAAWRVEAIREPVVEFFTEIYEKFSSMFTVKDEEMDYPNTIETEYLPTAIPTEYKIEVQNKNTAFNQIFYINESGSRIIFMQQTLSASHSMFDTEGAELYNVYVGNQSGQYFVNKGNVFLYWSAHDYLFFLSIPDSYTIEDAVRIAESLEQIE